MSPEYDDFREPDPDDGLDILRVLLVIAIFGLLYVLVTR